MKIYTKTGDDGSTGLVGGARVNKDDPRIESLGAVDELNAACGLASVIADEKLLAMLRAIQNELFNLGAQLAGSPDLLAERSIARLESEIDAADAILPPLKNFILPGGSELAARLHLARTICRRAERLLVALPAPPAAIKYLNRLSDWLFVHARLANHLSGIADIPWTR
jgi:cob(I)alamin adenosyltransferase